MKRLSLFVLIFSLSVCSVFAQSKKVLVYSHPNAETSIAGMQATYFAEKVFEYSNGNIKIEVYPNSQLGNLLEQEQLLKTGIVAFSHNTAASMGSLYKDFEVLDTPFMFKDIDHLLKVTNPQSPVMEKLNKGLLKSGVRVLYSFYFGTRQLTCNTLVKKPIDLKGLKIRAIPFPIYMIAVEGMGATPVPLDWIATSPALQAGEIDGQENPANTIVAAKLWESQKYLMMTNHIIPAEFVVMNDAVWKNMTATQQNIILRAAKEAAEFATSTTIAKESDDLKTLQDKGMKIISEKEGLDIEAFRSKTTDLVEKKFGKEWSKYYKLIEKLK